MECSEDGRGRWEMNKGREARKDHGSQEGRLERGLHCL